jgi:two-component system response regulator AtoC
LNRPPNTLDHQLGTLNHQVINLDDVPENIQTTQIAPAAVSGDPQTLRAVELRHLQEVLDEQKGNKVQAAKVLGISRRALYRLPAKHGSDIG